MAAAIQTLQLPSLDDISAVAGRNISVIPTSIIRLTTAPAYFGNILSWLFFGFLGLQFYTYVVGRPRDQMAVKLLGKDNPLIPTREPEPSPVYVVMLVNLIQVVFETYAGYSLLVAGWGDPIGLEKPPKFLITEPLFDALLALLVQNFYVYRIWVFRRTLPAKIFCVFISSLSVIQTVGGIAIPAIFFHIDVQARLSSATQVYNLLWLICGTIVDILITICMTFILRDAQSRTLTESTKTTLGKLIRLTIQSGALTAFLALVILGLFLNEEKIGLLQTLPGYILGKSYALSLLANLNLRPTHSNRPKSSENFTQQSSFRLFRSTRAPKIPGLSFLSTHNSDPGVISSSSGGIGTRIPASKDANGSSPVFISKHTEQFHDADSNDGVCGDDNKGAIRLQNMDATRKKYRSYISSQGRFEIS